MQSKVIIVDENNNPIGISTRKEAQAKGLWHRIVAVYVFNSKGELFIQKRSPYVDSSPNLWDHSAAGHMDEGEESENAALRELSEELGIKEEQLQQIALYKSSWTIENKILNRFWYLYKTIYDGEIKLQKEEVADGKFVTIDWLKKDFVEHPEIYSKGFRKSFSVYLESS